MLVVALVVCVVVAMAAWQASRGVRPARRGRAKTTPVAGVVPPGYVERGIRELEEWLARQQSAH